MASSSEHSLCLKESRSFTCNLCWEKGSGPAYKCLEQCQFHLHVTCAAMAKLQTHMIHHQHPLHLCRCSTGHVCDGCGKDIGKWAFRCNECDFDMHPLCVRAPRFILHPSHNHSHPLSLFHVSGDSTQCNGCFEHAKDGSYVYRCRTCNYDLHMSCASLPRRINHAQHPRHALILRFEVSNFFYCTGCKQMGEGWRYSCKECGFYLHSNCGSFAHGLPYANLDNNHVEREINLVSNSSLSFSSSSESSSSSSSSSSSITVEGLESSSITVEDLEALERILCFTRKTLKLRPKPKPGPSASPNENSNQSEEETCPTCLEEFSRDNPKTITGCKHSFHLPCILGWMERSSQCPVCRQNLTVLA